MLTKRIKSTIGIALFGLIPLAAPIVTTGVAQGHGWVTTPASRQDACSTGAMTNCGDIQWEPHSVEGPKGFPEAGPQDGTICAGGNGRFAELDEVREWPKTDVTAGQEMEFRWDITANHATSKWEYYITKDGWDPSQPLSRAQLEAEPFFAEEYGGKQPPDVFTHTGKLPDGKTGHHVILAVWEIADTANSFYACSDVNFG